jgi:hypothetical protein
LMPGVMAYGPTRDAGITAVRALALPLPPTASTTVKRRFMSRWPSTKAKQVLAALLTECRPDVPRNT